MTRLAFVFEEIMGHRTHTQNLAQTVRADAGVTPHYINVPGDCRWSKLRLIESNYLLRMSLAAYVALRPQVRRLDGALFHTQATSLLSTGLMRRLPAVISTDATPAQYTAFAAYGSAAPAQGRIAALKNRIYRRTFAHAHHLVTWSRWAAASMVSDYGVPPDKVSAIPPGVDTELYRPDLAARPADGVLRLLFVGAHFQRKGGDLLLRWARETRVSVPWELHVVTHGWPEETPGVFVHHSIANNSLELIRLYQRSDLFVLPTRADCFSLVTMEAMASGLPVLTTPVGGIGELVRHGENGLLIPPDNYEAFAGALDRLVTDTALCSDMSRAARETALADFDAAVNYRRLLDRVKSVAA